MNRLIIIGNGFDLAHGLPTGYCNFIDWYWNAIISKFSDLKNKFYEDDFTKVHLRFKQSSWYSAINDLKKTKNYNHFKNFIGKYSETYNPIYPEENFNRSYLQFKNNPVLNKI
ncbi:hypothetical protein CHU92_00385 [Flavobacterium cyanobacteriorum]|uniref:Bacteriophage abortive infection AbiH n=1 Tax=Flavobacterium cyanobacteriorum TaxID=2022802 RepID=A0A256A7V6_9FLAO|nr:AbiH family protein [Flavobacterium cyanobacteriorum]OYQ49265.1 hypothetical protein CHU92_00385 [Flavobacterium cyanobacteriorum]